MNLHLKISKLTTLFMVIITLVSCSDDEVIPNLGNIEVTLELAEGLTNISLEDLSVKVVNNTDNATYNQVTDVAGKTVFTDLPVGVYTITVEKATDNYNLSAIATDIVVIKQQTTAKTLKVNATNPGGGLVIKELYTVGAADNYVTLFKDQFIEIFNNSAEILYADGIYIANLHGETGVAGNINPITNIVDNSNHVYADFIDQIPGDGDDYPIAPGKSIVIALNAINFKENNPTADKAIDNTDATLERYSIDWLESNGRTGNTFFDLNNPDIPNMTNIYIMEPQNVYLFNSYGAAVVLVEADATFTDNDIYTYDSPTSSNDTKLMKVPVDKVIDGVDIVENSTAANFKRLPKAIDAGFHYLKADGGAFYSSMSSRRKKNETASTRFGRVVLQDTNNSSLDFEAIDAPDKYGYNN